MRSALPPPGYSRLPHEDQRFRSESRSPLMRGRPSDRWPRSDVRTPSKEAHCNTSEGQAKYHHEIRW